MKFNWQSWLGNGIASIDLKRNILTATSQGKNEYWFSAMFTPYFFLDTKNTPNLCPDHTKYHTKLPYIRIFIVRLKCKRTDKNYQYIMNRNWYEFSCYSNEWCFVNISDLTTRMKSIHITTTIKILPTTHFSHCHSIL